ncbi:MAG: hypothetical protein KJZ73_02795 [Pseudorhodoplanes sp.]|nr:hypothetical protein [Pseudorhodoplanes sp.]
MNSGSRLMICEGYEDTLFFQFLIEARNLPRFKIIDTSAPQDRYGGITKFKRAINGFRSENPRQFSALKDILIVADNDDDPAKNFALVSGQVNQVFGACPAKPLEAMARGADRPRITILMVPWTLEAGTLECLCKEASRDADTAIATHVDYFLANIRADQWIGETRKGKAWLRSYLAARCSDPFVPLGTVFRDHRTALNINHSSLNRVAEFLASFA